MRISLQASFEDVSVLGEILAGKLLSETTKGANFRRYSRVCRRTFGSRNVLHRIPENEVVDFKRIVSLPHKRLIPSSRARVAPPGTKVKTIEATAAPKEDIRKKRTGFWRVFKLKEGNEKKKTSNHHVDAASLLSFV